MEITKVEHDRLGRTTKVTDHDNNEVAYAWNAIGQRERLTYPDKSEVAYSYNTSGKLTEVVAGSDITSYTYDPMGRIAERILPNGATAQYTFNALGAISSLTHAKDGNILDQFKYSYDPAGNITEIDKCRVGVEADNGLFKYGYDPLNRLTEANGNKYAYDAVGNRIESLINGTASKHEFNAKNQLIKTFEGDNTTSYNYDKRGNLVEEILNGQQTASYAFDATNIMVAASTNKGNATYGYDGFRNRVKKLENMTDVRYINDITLPYNNLLSMNNQNYTWGNSLISGKDYYLQDHLGSPIRLLSNDGDIAQAFDEFGVAKTDSITSLQNPFGFTGYQTDAVSGLQYAQARYYNPQAGRFTAEDTHWNTHNMIFGDITQAIGQRKGAFELDVDVLSPSLSAIRQSTNLYAYVTNSPVMWVDPSGEIKIAALAVGAYNAIKSIATPAVKVGATIGGVGGGIGGGFDASIRGDSVPIGIASGAAGGAIGGGLVGLAPQAAPIKVVTGYGAVGGGFSSLSSQFMNHVLTNSTYRGFDPAWGEVVASAGTGAVFSTLGTSLGRASSANLIAGTPADVLQWNHDFTVTVFSVGNASVDVVHGMIFAVSDTLFFVPLPPNVSPLEWGCN